MVFRKGGFLGKCERWFLEGNEPEVVNSYTYLGYTFTTKLGLCQCVSPLAAKGKKATYDYIRVMLEFSELIRQTIFKMFDMQIQPIVLYGSQAWGLERIAVIEKIHTFACKRFSFFLTPH